jgi:uncharacterized protein (UPF0332 family)
MFYLAEALLLEIGIARSKHSGVIAAFGENIAKPGIPATEFHRYLIEGQDSRNVADYAYTSAMSRSDAEEQVLRAREFLKAAEDYMIP